MTSHDNQPPGGIWPVLYAYFDTHNRLDREAMRTQVDATIAAGAPGIVIAGLATEVHRLSPEERHQIIDWAVADIAGRVPLAVTITGDTVDAQSALADYAIERGASWIILQPPSMRDQPESFYSEVPRFPVVITRPEVRVIAGYWRP